MTRRVSPDIKWEDVSLLSTMDLPLFSSLYARISSADICPSGRHIATGPGSPVLQLEVITWAQQKRKGWAKRRRNIDGVGKQVSDIHLDTLMIWTYIDYYEPITIVVLVFHVNTLSKMNNYSGASVC